MKPETPVPNSGRKLFFGLFVFPLLIAVGMAVLLCSVVFLTAEKETPESLIAAIKAGSHGKRWQKAFELSNELNKNSNAVGKESLLNEMLHIFQDPAHYDAKTRAYMALALGHFNEPRAVEALISGLKENDVELQVYSLWSLGKLRAAASINDCEALLKNENPELRKVAAYVVGSLGEKRAAESLRPLLKDAVAEVRWNAALALARLEDDSGSAVLLEMLNRKTLLLENNMTDEAMEAVMINAVKGLTLIAKPDSIKILQDLSRSDKSLKVRQAAMQSLELLGRKTGQ